jgi:hypothetical protein
MAAPSQKLVLYIYLEKQVGSVVTIEGYPRSKWDIQFVFAKRFGALE